MDEPTPLAYRPRPTRVVADDEAPALQRQLEATRAALAQETRRREIAQAGWGNEALRHEATRAALAEQALRLETAQASLVDEQRLRAGAEAAAVGVVQAARNVLGVRTAAAATPTGPAERLAFVLDVVTAPIPASADQAGEVARRFEAIRAHLTHDSAEATRPR